MSVGPVSILTVADARAAAKNLPPPRDGAALAAVGFQILGGCAVCHASLAAYNAYPSRYGYWACLGCLDGAGGGYASVAEFEGEQTVKAVEAATLTNGSGRPIPMEAGPCLWCGLFVESDRDAAGATDPYDPCWQIDGDFGCDMSPETTDEGVGDHARPYDLAVRLLNPARKGEAG